MRIVRTLEFTRWLDRLADERARSRIELRLVRVAVGNPDDVRSVGDGVFEMRIDYGPGYRIYFVQRGDRLLLLLRGGDKRSRARDIIRAKRIAERREAQS